ncbi:MAG: SRPBCC family protein [Acidobacteriota bacterium]
MRIERTFTINASADQVWTVLGPQFDRVSEWVSAVQHSAPRAGQGPGSAPMAGRTCQTDLGPFQESILEYDEERRVVAYDAQGDTMPFFVRHLRNRWQVEPATGGTARVEMRMQAELQFPFDLLMGPLMKRRFAKVLDNATTELTYYVETGEPHPRKVQARRAIARAA